MSLEITAQVFIDRVFTDEGPRDGWEKGMDDSMVKCLEAGRLGLMLVQEELNDFLEACELPKATFFERPEYLSRRNYLVLSVPRAAWEEKIGSIHPVTNEKRSQLTVRASNALEPKVPMPS